MSDKSDTDKPAVRAAMAELLTSLVMLEDENPVEIERVARLFEKKERGAFLAKYIRVILPASFDTEAFEAMLDGRLTAPLPDARGNAQQSRKPGARGAYSALQKQVGRAAIETGELRDKLALAEAREAALRDELEVADKHLRATVVLRLLDQFSKTLIGPFMLGPAWTLVRSISGYLQTDHAYEEALDAPARERYEQHRAGRTETAAEIIKYLDRYCGDAAFEVTLHEAILAAGRERDKGVKRELEMRNYNDTPLSKHAKVPGRTNDERRVSVRPGARLSDRSDVLNGIPAAARDDDSADIGNSPQNPDNPAQPSGPSDRPW